MPELIVRPDTTWNLECIRERFEVPEDSVPSALDTPAQFAFKSLFIDACAKEAGKKAIAKYERLRHWKFRDDIPVELDESELQFDIDDWEFTSPVSKSPFAVDQGHLRFRQSKHAYVIKLWFETQELQTVVYDSDEYGHPEGYSVEEEVWQPYNTPEEKNRA